MKVLLTLIIAMYSAEAVCGAMQNDEAEPSNPAKNQSMDDDGTNFDCIQVDHSYDAFCGLNSIGELHYFFNENHMNRHNCIYKTDFVRTDKEMVDFINGSYSMRTCSP